MTTIKEIIINDGNVFQGTVDMFRDCFFDNAYPNVIEDWCESQNMKCEIIYKKDEKYEY